MNKLSHLLGFRLLSLRNKSAPFAACAIVIIVPIQAALASDAYPMAYDASYEVKNARGTTPMRMLSNGKGQTRSDVGAAGQPKTTSIVDYPNKTTWTVIEGAKMIMKGPLRNTPATPMNEESAKKMNATDLGMKMVNGHDCQGWRYKDAQGTTEVWIDKVVGVPVKSTSVTKLGTTELNLKQLSTNPPGDSYFKIPANQGYSVRDMTQ